MGALEAADASAHVGVDCEIGQSCKTVIAAMEECSIRSLLVGKKAIALKRTLGMLVLS